MASARPRAQGRRGTFGRLPQRVPMSDLAEITAPDPVATEPSAFRIPLPSGSVFDGLPPEARRALEDELEWFSVPGGRVLYQAGDAADGLYLVLSGCLGIVGTAAGHTALLAEVVAGGTV